MSYKLVFCTFAMLMHLEIVLGQDNEDSSLLQRLSLQDYSLAKCSDGSPAAYYAERASIVPESKVMIYLADSGEKNSSFGGSCTYINDCFKTCQASPGRCQAPFETTKVQTGGIWSRNDTINPFANYFKVYLPSCSLDEFSGTRGPLDKNGDTQLESGALYLHGRYILNALLRDLVDKFGMEKAASVVLIGSGSGARGVARSCDFVKDALSIVNPTISIKCILDGPPDFVPFWMQDDEKTAEHCLKSQQALVLKDEEARRFLWGRADDESCIKDFQNKTNSSILAQSCGVFSRSFREISTPIFVISNQLDPIGFKELTCGINAKSSEYIDYSKAWRRGVLQLAEAMSNEKPDNGLFIPNCEDETNPYFLDELSNSKRTSTKVPLFISGEEKNLFQVLKSWLEKGSTDDEHLAIDPFGIINLSCSIKKSGNLRSLNLDLRPDLLRRRGIGPASIVKVVARKPLLTAALAVRDRDPSIRSRYPSFPKFGLGDEDGFSQFPQFNDQDLFSSHFIDGGDDGSDKAAAAAAGAAAVAALVAVDRNRKYSQPSRDPFSSSRFLPPADLTSPRINDPNLSLDSLDYDLGEDDFDFGGIFPATAEVTVQTNTRPVSTRPALSDNPTVLSQSRSRKARLWKRLHYLQYLKELYKWTYRDYYFDYYYGRSGSNNGFGRLVKEDNNLDIDNNY